MSPLFESYNIKGIVFINLFPASISYTSPTLYFGLQNMLKMRPLNTIRRTITTKLITPINTYKTIN